MSTFKLPSQRLRRSLAKAQKQYAMDLNLAAGFLNARGITDAWAAKWGLGVAASPLPSHDRFRGRLCIPYCDKVGVVALKFRCMQPHDCKQEGHSKYDQPASQIQRLFNVASLDSPGLVAHVAEGEMDALVLSEVLAQPVVGVPGVDHWQPHWVAHFRAFERVVLWQQGDKAGRGMGATWGRKVGAELVELPEGHDVNSYYLEYGAEALKALNEGEPDEG